MSKLYKNPTVVYGQVNQHTGGNYVALYENLEDIFDEDTEDQEILVFKLAHKALVSRKTKSVLSVKRKR